MQSSGRGVCAAQRYPGYVGAHIPWGHLEIDQHFWSWHLSLSLLQGRRSSVCFTKIISAAMSFLFCVCTAASDRASPHHITAVSEKRGLAGYWKTSILSRWKERKIPPKTFLPVKSFVTASSCYHLSLLILYLRTFNPWFLEMMGNLLLLSLNG